MEPADGLDGVEFLGKAWSDCSCSGTLTVSFRIKNEEGAQGR